MKKQGINPHPIETARAPFAAHRAARFFRRAAVFLACLVAQPALGAGLILYEINAPSTGTASAGWAALANDASTAFTNPAGMTHLDRSQLLGGVQPVIMESEFDPNSGTMVIGGGNDGGNAGAVIPSLSGYYVQKLGEDWRVGFSMGSFFGLGLDYDDDWVGRYYVQEGDFLTLQIGPSVAYRLFDCLSIGGSVGAVYGKFSAKAALRNLEDMAGDGRLEYEDTDWGVGGSAGILYEPLDNLRFGATYYSPVKLDFKDRPDLHNVGPLLQAAIDLTGNQGRKLGLGFKLPQWVMVSAYYEPIENLGLMLNANWQDWSEFGFIDVNLDSLVDTTIDGDYHDTFHVAAGVQYRFCEKWLASVGFAYDSSPVNEKNRSVTLPLDRQIRYATGLQYDWTENVTVGLAYEYIDAGNADVDQSRNFAGDLDGDYSPNRIQVVNVNLIWRF